MSKHDHHDDVTLLESFHYKQELQRSIRLFGSFATAFSFISITTGIFTNYGFILSTGGPAAIWSWPITVVGQVLVALVFAELAGRAPLTGYSYQWVTRLTNPGLGWMAGWLSFAFLVLVVPAVDGGMAPVLAGMLGVEQVPFNLKTIILITLSLQAILNIRGVRISASINNVAVFTETVGMIGLTILLGAVALFRGNTSPAILFQATGDAGGSYVGPFMLTMLMGLFTLVGFEAPANLSEETVDARRTVPKAVMSSVILSGVMGTLFLVFATWAIPDLGATVASGNPLPYIIESGLGPVVGTFFLVLVVVSIFACGLVITTSASRLVYALARDNVFVGNGWLRKVSPVSGAPVNAVILVWFLGALGTLFSESLVVLVGATSVLPALIYLLTVLAYRFGKGEIMQRETAFPLGRWSGLVANAAILWLVFAIGILTLPKAFHTVGYLALGIIVVGLLLYFAVVQPKIKAGKAGVSLQPVPGDD